MSHDNPVGRVPPQATSGQKMNEAEDMAVAMQERHIYQQTSTQNPLMGMQQTYAPIGKPPVSILPGAAFNTTPVYDAQGTLVGLEPSSDNNAFVEELRSEGDARNVGYISIPMGNPYGDASNIDGNFSHMNYNQFVRYSPSTNQSLAASPPLIKYPNQFYTTSPRSNQLGRPINTQPGSVEFALDPSCSLPRRNLTQQHFDACPTVCSLFAILCCPITLWCSLPALVYSLCAYTDHRTADAERYQHKSDIARHLVITACVIGLLLCATWAILAFFYYEVIINVASDILTILRHRLQSTV